MLRLPLLALLALAPSVAVAQDGRTRTRLLYSFETPGETAQLLKVSENSSLIVVADIGVTHGKNCARWVAKRGGDYGVLHLGPTAIRDWRDFDYLAIDVTVEAGAPNRLVVELWDGLTKGYPTRCTFEDVRLKPGRQTLLYPIHRARRNSKEGRSWEELEPQDKMDLGKLTRVKLFLDPTKDHDSILWIDNIRLLQEDAAKPKLALPLPFGAIAFKFGSAGEKIPGFVTVSSSALGKGKQPGFVETKGLAHAGTGWPDAVAGTFVLGGDGQMLDFRATVPAGKYRVWLCAGPIYRTAPASRTFLLRVADRTLTDTTPTAREYLSEKHLHRFVDTFYSEKNDALWSNYVDRMYPVRTFEIDTRGEVRIQAVNHFLSALILVPTSLEKSAWENFLRNTAKLRREAFAKTLGPLPGKKPTRGEDEEVIVFVPDALRRLEPRHRPTPAERKTKATVSVAKGHLAIVRVGITSFVDRECGVSLGAWNAGLDAKEAVVYGQDWRFDGEQLQEAGLKPLQGKMLSSPRGLPLEAGLTRGIIIVQPVPRDTKAGTYATTLTLGDRKIPVSITVHPFTVEEILPLSLGMYYGSRTPPGLPEAESHDLTEQQLQFLRRLGMTATVVGSGVPVRLGGSGTVEMRFDATMFDLARKVGMGRHPKQYQMGTALGVGRGIGRRLPGSLGAKVDQNPGIELRQPGFRDYFLDAMKKQKAFNARMKLPVAVEIVDEPREVPNPWNRNLADSIVYGDLLHEVGLTTFITPMGDSNSGKDYTILVDHADILSTHGGKGSAKFMRKTLEKKKTLWLYNTGMDRFSWGFYAWRVGAEGRWEWHFCSPEDQAKGGYPGREWHNPFTGSQGLACDAPLKYPGGMLFQSAFLDAAEGIADYAYLFTLQSQLLKRAESPAHADTVKEAREFLAALKRAIPEFPEVKGLAGAEDGALVGLGVSDEARLQTPSWRARVVKYLTALAKE